MLSKNQIHTVRVTDMNDLGYGVARIEGVVTLVENGVTEDVLTVKLIKVARDYAVARIEAIAEPSLYRIASDCAAFPRCGGCAFRHITREYELSLKEAFVRQAFRKQRIEADVLPVLTDGRVDGYRNKVQFPVGPGGVLGYYARHSHDIVPCGACRLTDPALGPIAEAAAAYLRRTGAPVKHLYLRRGRATGETMVCFVTAERRLPAEDETVRSLTRAFPEVKSIVVNRQPNDSNVILGDEVRVLYGRDGIDDVLCGCRFTIASRAFYQVNPGAAALLYGEAIRLAAKDGAPDRVTDLYCGAGTIGIALAGRYPQTAVTGVEIVPEAVENARRNAEQNGIRNARFLCADAGDAGLPESDVLIVDPPRKGLSPALIDRIVKAGIERVVYVSCEPDTLARDAAAFLAAGYRLGSVQPVDMFPRTGHVETVCLLSKLSEAKHHISIQVDMDELDLTAAESKATYEEIQEWVQEKYGFHVTHLNIAQVKRKHGIIERENYNKPKSSDSKQPGCPEEKLKAIEAALKHFQMI